MTNISNICSKIHPNYKNNTILTFQSLLRHKNQSYVNLSAPKTFKSLKNKKNFNLIFFFNNFEADFLKNDTKKNFLECT